MKLSLKQIFAILVFLTSLVSLEFSFAANANKVEEQGALTELKTILEPIHSLQGNFQQKIMNDRGKVLRQTEGKMWLKKPGQFRWELSGRDQHVIISDGKQIWDYDPELSQVTIQKIHKGQKGAPIYFLTGDVSSIDKEFTVKSLGQGQCMQESDHCFELKPRVASNSFHWIKVGFLGKVLKEIELLDQFGQRSIFNFNSVTMNGNIPAQQFHFTPPKGVDVVRS